MPDLTYCGRLGTVSSGSSRRRSRALAIALADKAGLAYISISPQPSGIRRLFALVIGRDSSAERLSRSALPPADQALTGGEGQHPED